MEPNPRIDQLGNRYQMPRLREWHTVVSVINTLKNMQGKNGIKIISTPNSLIITLDQQSLTQELRRQIPEIKGEMRWARIEQIGFNTDDETQARTHMMKMRFVNADWSDDTTEPDFFPLFLTSYDTYEGWDENDNPIPLPWMYLHPMAQWGSFLPVYKIQPHNEWVLAQQFTRNPNIGMRAVITGAEEGALVYMGRRVDSDGNEIDLQDVALHCFTYPVGSEINRCAPFLEINDFVPVQWHYINLVVQAEWLLCIQGLFTLTCEPEQ